MKLMFNTCPKPDVNTTLKVTVGETFFFFLIVAETMLFVDP